MISLGKMDDYDVIVIGTGISGLLSALALSKEGKKVLILEKEEEVGGVCRSYEVDGYRVDTGPHAITRLERGPLRELMERYFDVVPNFIPFGTYYVRIDNRVKPFPWNVKNWLTFDLLPTHDRLLLMKSLFDMLSMVNNGQDLSKVAVSEVLSPDISINGKKLLDWCSYFLLGTSMDSAPISRFIDNKDYHANNSVPYLGRLYNLLLNEGALDQGYPKGGLQSIINCILNSFPKNKVEIKTGEKAIRIEGEEKVEGVVTENDHYPCKVLVYSGFASKLTKLIQNISKEYSENLKSIQKVNSLGIWLGLSKKVFKKQGSEMWITSDPYAWVVPTSNYDASLAPQGKQLAGFAFVLPQKYNLEKVKKKALETIFETLPEIENQVEMVHYQELVPEKASWNTTSGFGEVKTPLKNLYLVGTDAEKRSAGVSRAAYSVLNCLEEMKTDRNL